MRARRNTAAVVAIVAALVAGAPAAATPTSALPPDATAARAGTPITLVTGDRVLLRADGSVADIDPGPGRSDIPFRTFRSAGHTHVVPADAVRLLATDRLDRRLFDLTLLREMRYDDRSRDTLPLIVDGAVPGATVNRRLPGRTAIDVDRDGRDWAALTTAEKVWLDGPRRASLDESVPRIGAPAAWDTGLTGTGVTVAVLDTGVDEHHPALAGREVAEANFSSAPDTVDRVGHGTHVASTIAGDGAEDGVRYRGVAPGARLLDAKVLDDNGWGSDSTIIAGMHWAAEHGARIVNLSLGSWDTPGVDPVEAAVNTLSAERGILVVAAAGNGYRPGTISSPASAKAALAVSAVDRDGAVATFASRGPGLDNVLKPELTAPGVDITAAAPGGGYATASGTSMAAPHVSGAAALVAQRHPEWTGTRLRASLIGSAVPTSDAPVFEQGAGRVDVAAALATHVHTTPAALDFGLRRYPHEGQETRTVTYHNDGPNDVTLDLAVDGAGFSLSAERVHVPAGGQAPVQVTAQPGSTSTTVTAVSGAETVRTPVGVVWEPESYDLTINVIGRDGRPATTYDVLRMGFDDGYEFLFDPDGTITTRVPAGLNPLQATVYVSGTALIHMVSYPALTVTEDTTVTLDARTARPVRITLPDDAPLDGLNIGYGVYRSDLETVAHSVLYGGETDLALAHAGPALPGDQVTSWLAGQWDDGRYHLAWFRNGGVHTGFVRRVRERDLAMVTTRLVAHAPGATGRVMVTPSPVGGFNRVLGRAPMIVPAPEDLDLPTELTTYVNDDAEWTTTLDQSTPNGGYTEVETTEQWYRAGTRHRRVLGHPVLGPALPATRYEHPGVSRTGDRIVADIPLFGDAAGNAGSSSYDTGRSALHRGDSLIGEVPRAGGGTFEVPPEPGRYRLTTSATRSGFALSTRVSATWTFSSAHVPGDAWHRVPLSVIGFRPSVSENGEAPSGRFSVPVVVTGPSGEPVRPRRLTVEVSYDDGSSWRRVPVTRQRVAKLYHPPGAESVSLRARAVRRNGDTVEQTIIRAYLLD